MQKQTQRKIITHFFIAITIFFSVYGILMKPQPAKAWPVVDTFAPTWDEIWQLIQPAITDTVKTFVIRFAYEDVLKWVSGEKGGKPAFITDFDDWLFKQADLAGSQFLEQTLGDAYKTLCTGINVNLALYWKPQFDIEYYIPECRLSEIQRRFQNPGTEWIDFQAYLVDSNNDSGYLFEVYSKAQERKESVQLTNVTQAIAGNGFVKTVKNIEGKDIVQTPGAVISDLVSASQQASYDVITNSDAWTLDNVSSALLQGLVLATMKRGLNTLSNATKNK